MATARSKLSVQGRTSVPAAIRKALGVAPGSVLEWDQQDGHVVVRRAGRYTSKDVNGVLFPDKPGKTSRPDMKTGIRSYIRTRHPRQ